MRCFFFVIIISSFLAATPFVKASLSDQQKKVLFIESKKAESVTTTSSSLHHKKKKHSSSSSTSSKKKSSPRKKHASSSNSSSSIGNHSSETTTHFRSSIDSSSSSEVAHSSTISHNSSSSTKTHTSTPPYSYSSSTSSSSIEKSSSPPRPSHFSSLPHDRIIPIDTTHDETTIPTIRIEKSGILPDEGLEPAPSPEKKHGLGWIFGRGNPSYHYLSWSVRRSIDRAPVRHGRWKYIVVHNSGTRAGNARSFDIYHRRVRKMVNGLAYHFVIGNGVSSGNGEIEIGHRWIAQLQGGHVASDYLNDISIGICLVGDYNRDLPTKAQIGALNELIAYLRQRVGRTQGQQAIVEAHREINPRPTDCPGNRFPYGWLHERFGKGR